MQKNLATLALLAAWTAAVMPALAAAEPPPGDFAEHKAKMIAHMQERIAKEQAELACVQAAQNHDAIKACRPEGKDGPGPGPRPH